ncbi:hypothetical protein BCR39DRAFT_524145 [Naematelia encephala]|uniref:HSF-type DNA-binding domain-containing protein n=1 Tax=Naematelia encephala TaxID=71784 RepID=A0A1Y2BB89_9TREE|nr:hypothetical protein BCR39DRAFT_524145 [Naematelia encephala]
MSTGINAVAGPSSTTSTPSPKIEPMSPPIMDEHGQAVSKQGLSVDENGEVIKVPAFLNKLFSMVSDTSTDELIYWSDSGDSFFVPNHERFGKELLPKFFKHSNFSSFVRQLNMYGFHKVPHLQSGVLKNENPQELWEFVNPFFKRGQQHLLSRVTRKNNRPGNIPMPTAAGAAARVRAGAGPFLITDGTVEGESGMLVGPSGQQMLDISALSSNIAALRQTQASIVGDLKALKTSQEHLWRQALESQERHQKHQETIDLIVTFLERLFGTEGEGLKGLKEALRRGGIGRPREDSTSEEGVSKKRKRLGVDRMIGDGRDEDEDRRIDESGRIVELSSDQQTDPGQFSVPRIARSRSSRQSSNQPMSTSVTPQELWSSASQRFTTLPTDDEPSPVPSTSTEGKPKPTYAPPNFDNLQPHELNSLAPYGQHMLNPNNGAGTPAPYNLDPALLQTTIGSLLQSPAAAQMFLNTLNNSVQGQALQTPTKAATQPNNYSPIAAQGEPSVDPTLALFSPLPNHSAMMNDNAALLKTYEDAAAMGTDVDKLQESIDELVRSMGLELPNGYEGTGASADGTTMSVGNGSDHASGHGQLGGEDTLGDAGFDVDEFLEQLGKTDGGTDGSGVP